jgi:putative endonuclease
VPPEALAQGGDGWLPISAKLRWCRLWYVYFLKLRNGDFYVGSTNDLRRRVSTHNIGRVKSTRLLLPAKLEAYVAVADERRARALEKYFKSGSGKAFSFKRLVNRQDRAKPAKVTSEG